MIAHVVEFHAPETIGMQGFRERVLPVLQEQPGFTGEARRALNQSEPNAAFSVQDRSELS